MERYANLPLINLLYLSAIGEGYMSERVSESRHPILSDFASASAFVLL